MEIIWSIVMGVIILILVDIFNNIVEELWTKKESKEWK